LLLEGNTEDLNSTLLRATGKLDPLSYREFSEIIEDRHG